MDVQQKLDEIAAAVRGARGMPMSASCVVNRADLLAGLGAVREALPGSLAEAREVIGGREQVVAEAQQEAQRIIEAAHAERRSLVDNTEIVRQARAEAARVAEETRRQAEEVKAEADDYVDSKLANFEVVLGKTIGSVDRGREKLLGPDRGDPQELLQRADEYVEAQFTAIETVLRKTLEAVGRGRQKLTGHRPIDELAEHVARQEGQGVQGALDTEQDTYGYLGMSAPGALPQDGGQEHRAPSRPAADPYGTAAVPAQGGYAQNGPGQEGAYGQETYGRGAYAPPPGYEGYPRQEAAGYEGYAPDGYASGGYAPAAYGEAPYAGQEQQSGYGYRPSGVLDETSLFDTGMLDAEQLRRYEQGYQ